MLVILISLILIMNRMEATYRSLWDEEFLEVNIFSYLINALVCEEGDFVLNPE